MVASLDHEENGEHGSELATTTTSAAAAAAVAGSEWHNNGWTMLAFAPIAICDVRIRYTDLKLEVRAHRYVLMQHSAVYRAMIEAMLADKTDVVEMNESPYPSAADAESFFQMLYARHPDRDAVREARRRTSVADKLRLAHLLDRMGCVSMFQRLAGAWEVDVSDGDSFLLRMPIEERVQVARRYHWAWLLDATVARLTKQEAETVQAKSVVAFALATRMAAVIFQANFATRQLRELIDQIHERVEEVRGSIRNPHLRCRDRPYCEDEHEHDIDWLQVDEGDFARDTWAPLHAIDALATETARKLDATLLRVAQEHDPPSTSATATAAAAGH